MSSVLKGTTMSPSARKLVSVTEPEIPPKSTPVADVKSRLRQEFAEELEQLREATISAVKGELASKFERELAEAKRQQTLELENTVSKRIESLAKVETLFVQAIERINQLDNNETNKAEALAVEIAFASVVKLLGDHKNYEQALRELITHALNELGDEAPRQIRVSVEDYKTLTAHSDNAVWLKYIAADEALTIGACVIHSLESSIDAGMSIQLENLRSMLLNTFRRI